MTREEFIKQRCEIDKITEEEFERTYRVVECNCGKIYCNGYRCLDLDGLLKENQELKKQLEESDRKLFFTKNELDMREKSIDDKLTQQKEFIKWLENYINLFDKKDIYEEGSCDTIEEILQKYKSIIGVSDEKK